MGHTWVGTHAVSFTNLDAVALDTIYLRTWSNGVLGCGAHSITVSSMVGGTVVDDSALACTEIEVTLDAPLAQGERTTLSMDLEIDVPARNDRFGYHHGLALMGTALPTLEVHDDQGWHHDPFIDLGESFYSIVGNYHVTLNTPEALDTPTSGVVASSSTPAPGRRETTYVAKDVRDFAWAAGRLRRMVGSSGDTRVVVSYQLMRSRPAWRGRPCGTPSDPSTRSRVRSGRSRTGRWTSCSPGSRRSAAWSTRRSSSPTRSVHGEPRARPPVLVRHRGRQRVRRTVVGRILRHVVAVPAVRCLEQLLEPPGGPPEPTSRTTWRTGTPTPTSTG